MKPHIRNTKRVVGYLLLFAALGGCATMTPIRQHPDFASHTREVKTIVVLPPDVEHTRIVFDGDNERIMEKEQTIASELNVNFGSTLTKKHYIIRQWKSAVPDEGIKDLSFELQQVRAAYREAAKQLYDKPANEEEAKNYRVSLGPVVNPVASAQKADALLYVRYDGFEKSGGQMTKDIIAGALLGLLTGTAVVPAQEGAALEVALIDGTTGDVLWVNRGRNAGPGALGHGAATMVENILTRLPGDEKVFTVQRNDSSGETAPATHSGFQQE